jgi:hypothetical protein
MPDSFNLASALNQTVSGERKIASEAREAFEAWAKGPAGYVDDQLAKYADGSYQDSITRGHWSIFAAGWRRGTAFGAALPVMRQNQWGGWTAVEASQVSVGYCPSERPPCRVCGKPASEHGSYPTCATHPYTSDGRCQYVIGAACVGAECRQGCVRGRTATTGQDEKEPIAAGGAAEREGK